MTKIEALELELAARKMVEGTELEWWSVIRNIANHYFNPALFIEHPLPAYELALGIVEDKPVWAGDKIWIEDTKVKQVIFTQQCFDANRPKMSWNQPKPKGVEMNDKIRKEFEQWRDESPNQRYGNAVQEAWYAGRESIQKEINTNASRYFWLRNNRHLNDWWSVGGPKDMYENIDADIDAAMLESAQESQPINPDEVYSPHTIITDDKCRKCAGQMQAGYAIDQTFTGKPDFIGSDEVVTVSPGGSGKMIECRKCSECGWSTT